MQQRLWMRFVAGLLAVGMVVHQAEARGGAAPCGSLIIFASPAAQSVHGALSDAQNEARLAGARAVVAQQLVALERPAAEAWGAANQLTPADLDVLLANPAMLQPAGALSSTTQALLIGILIIAGIIALGLAADGGV